MVDLNEGIAILGGSFGIIWMMIGLVYTLQFTKMANIGENALVFAIGFLFRLGLSWPFKEHFTRSNCP